MESRRRPPWQSRLVRSIGNLLILVGLLILLSAGALQAYGMYAQFRWQQEQAALSNQFVLPAAEATPFAEQAAAALPSAAAAEQTATADTPTAAPTVTADASTAGAPAAPFVRQPTSTPASAPSSTPAPPLPSDPGRLVIPKLKVDAAIVKIPFLQGQWDLTHLIYDVGLLEGTGFPGRKGNAALSAHVSLKGRGNGPFYALDKLVPGDEVIVRQADASYTFRVTRSRVVPPTEVSVLDSTDNPTLTLITCTDWDFLKAEYVNRRVVSAALVAQAYPPTPAQ